MLSIVFGIAFIILGLWGIFHWWAYFVMFMKGMLPFMFGVGGLITIIAGIVGLVDRVSERTNTNAAEEKK